MDATAAMGDVRFTEEMAGFFTPGAPAWDAGFHTGRVNGTTLMFHLTIGTDDVDRFLADPQHACPATGWVGCPTLGGQRLTVERGTFNLFAPGTAAGRLAMHYRLWFRSSEGAPLTLVGFKDIGNDPGFDLWHDTTTLFTTIFHGHVEEGMDGGATEEGRGLLVIQAAMFARQLTTFRGRPRPLARFVGMFAGSLIRVYGRRPPRGTRV